MAPKKDIRDTIKDLGNKVKDTAKDVGKKAGGLGEKIKNVFRVQEEESASEKPVKVKPATVKDVKVRPAKKTTSSSDGLKKLPKDAPTEETVVFSDDMTKQFSPDAVNKPSRPLKKSPTPKKEMTQEIPVVGKRSLFKPRDKKPNFALGVVLTTIKTGFVAIVIVVAIAFGSLFGVANAYLGSTPELDVGKIETQSENSQIYLDSDGSLLATYTGLENREWANLEEIPKDLQNAFIALEDIRFYDHNGVDFRRLVGAFFSNVSTNSSQGGSTITQQLVKNELLTNERSYKRKLQEAYLATELESTYSKDDILEAYLNAIPLGGLVYGVKAAAKDYFNKDLSSLTLKEMICIASITQNPTKYNPRRATYTKPENLPGLINRMNIDAERMYWNGNITKEQYDEISTPSEEYLAPECLEQDSDGKWKLKEGADMVLREGFLDTWKAEMNILEKSPTSALYEYPHFVEYVIYDVQTFLLEKEGLEDTKANRNRVDRELRTGGYRIYATIDPGMQQSVQDTLANWENYPDMASKIEHDADGNPYEIIQPQSTAVVIDNSTGQLKAIVGSRTTPDKMRTFNRAYNGGSNQGQKQVGSSIKPIAVYGPAFELGYGEGSYVPNIDEDIKGWLDDEGKPSHPKLTGANEPITIHDAIVNSRNVAAAQTIMNYVGVENSVEYLYKLGVSEESLQGTSTGAGLSMGGSNISPIEMAGAYATIARGGEYKQPISFTKVLDSKGNVVIDAENDREIHEAFSAGTCFMLTDSMEDALISGTGTKARLDNMTTAGKTGTNDGNRGMFFAGYTPYYTSTLWVGNDSFEIKLPTGDAGRVVAPIWKTYMQKIHENLPDKAIMEGTAADYGLAEATVCKYSNKKPSSGVCAPVQALMPVNSPLLEEDCDVCVSSSSSEVKICSVSGLLFVDGVCPEASAQSIPISSRTFAKGSPYENWSSSSTSSYTGVDGLEYPIPTESCSPEHHPIIVTPTPTNPIPSPVPTIKPQPTPSPVPTPTVDPTEPPAGP